MSWQGIHRWWSQKIRKLIISGNWIFFIKDKMWVSWVSWSDVDILDEIPALLNSMEVFPFTETTSSLHLSFILKAQWRHSKISSLETNLICFRNLHSLSYPALFHVFQNHQVSQQTALIHERPHLYKLHWITDDTALPSVGRNHSTDSESVYTDLRKSGWNFQRSCRSPPGAIVLSSFKTSLKTIQGFKEPVVGSPAHGTGWGWVGFEGPSDPKLPVILWFY